MVTTRYSGGEVRLRLYAKPLVPPSVLHRVRDADAGDPRMGGLVHYCHGHARGIKELHGFSKQANRPNAVVVLRASRRINHDTRNVPPQAPPDVRCMGVDQDQRPSNLLEPQRREVFEASIHCDELKSSNVLSITSRQLKSQSQRPVEMCHT